MIKTANGSENFIKALKDTSDKVYGKGITLTDEEIKDIMKVIKFLEDRRILLKGTNRKIASQEGGFLHFLRPLMTAGLPLMKSVLTPLARSVLLPLGLSPEMLLADAGTTALIISNEEIKDIMKIVK